MSGEPNVSGGLTQAFKKANHVRHNIMDASMLLMAIGAAVLAAGPMVAVFDPITPFIKMHFDGFLMAFDTLPDFITHAWENLSDSVFSSGVDVGSVHGATAAGHAAHIGIEAQFLQFDQWLQGLSPEQFLQIQGDLKDVYGGMSLRQYHEMNFLNHGPVPW